MSNDAFAMPFSRAFVTALVHATRPLWRWLGNVETKVMSDQIRGVELDRPVYVTGLARAGTTILLEILASHPDTVSHQYRDFPFLWTPGWWHQVLDNNVRGYIEPTERAHGDRIQVTPESPEAMEEVLWMGFFDGLHDPSTSNILRANDENPRFDQFYRDHIRKLLAVRGGTRYLAKGNYNVTRLSYLHRLFPTARFVVPVRSPVYQVASLRKQHRLFTEASAEHPRSVGYLNRVGHFEFGANRTPINVGDDDTVASIQELWANGEDVRGWARYWASIYEHVADQLDHDRALADSTLLVRYEKFCADPENELWSLLTHCDLYDESVVERWAPRISAPSYYTPDFTDAELSAIDEETRHIARRLEL